MSTTKNTNTHFGDQSQAEQKSSDFPKNLDSDPIEIKKVDGVGELDSRSVADSYLYQSSNNSDEISKISSNEDLQKLVSDIPKLSPYHKKQAHIVYENCQKFIDQVGLSKVGFLTLTFPDHVTDHKEAGRRFNNLNRRFLSKYFGQWAWQREEQKSGRWHYHILIDCKEDIRTNFDFSSYMMSQAIRDVAYKNGLKYKDFKKHLKEFDLKYIRSASTRLSELWKLMKYAMKKYGFGISELMPIRTNDEAAGRYMGKYVSNHIEHRKESSKGARLSGYSKNFIRSCTKFQWNTDNSKLWRKKLSTFAMYVDCKNLDELSEKFGPRWAYHFQDIIFDLDNYSKETVLKFIENHNSTKKILDNHSGPQYVVDLGVLIDRATGQLLF